MEALRVAYIQTIATDSLALMGSPSPSDLATDTSLTNLPFASITATFQHQPSLPSEEIIDLVPTAKTVNYKRNTTECEFCVSQKFGAYTGSENLLTPIVF